MVTAASNYQDLVTRMELLDGVVAGQMFGKPCLKVHGKAFMAQHKDTVVFKLGGIDHAKAIALAGANLWDPSGKARAMKEWVALPVTQCKHYDALAHSAMSFVISQQRV